MSLRLKLILASVAALGSVMVGGAWHFSALQNSAREAEARNRAELVLTFGEACRSYTKKTLRPAIDAVTDEMILEAKSSTFVTKRIMEALGRGKAHYSYRQPTTNPLNPQDRADPFEAQLLERFRASADLRELEGHRVIDGLEQYYVARPIVVERSCLDCHGNPEDAPAAIIETYGSENGFHWREGEIVSAVLISIPTSDLRARQSAMTRTVLAGLGIMTLAMVWVLYALFERIVNRRIRVTAGVMREVAADPLSGARIRDRRADELGALASAFDSMADSLGEAHGLLEQKVKERTTELVAAEARMRAILESAGESIMMTDRAGIVQYVNPAYTDLTGYSVREVVGNSSDRTTSGKQSRGFYKEMWATISEGHAWKGDLINRRKDGTLYDSHLTITPVSGANGAIEGFVAVQRDITAGRELQERLRSAREAAESAAEAKGQFLANMSHEIRTPMNGIIGMAELALDADLDPEQRESLETIHACAESLQVLLNDILDFSKIESGKLRFESIDFEVGALLNGVVGILSQPAAVKGLELTKETAPNIPVRLRGDPVRLRQVLLNLGTNAIKFTAEGSVRFSAELVRNDDEACMLRFSVTDTGIGIPEARQAKIFDEFVQADSSTTRKHGGTGLGLAISKRIVELLSGEMLVESVPGQGSTFSFTVVLCTAEGSLADETSAGDRADGDAARSAASLHEPGRATVAAEGEQPQAPRKVLLVEDNPVNQKIACRLLERQGCGVTCAENGRIALDVLRDETFDLVFMDIQMPEMDGFECTRRIRGGDDPNLPIIAMTAHAMSGDRERCLAAGMSDYIAKPVRMEELRRILDRWSQESMAARQRGNAGPDAEDSRRAG